MSTWCPGPRNSHSSIHPHILDCHQHHRVCPVHAFCPWTNPHNNSCHLHIGICLCRVWVRLSSGLCTCYRLCRAHLSGLGGGIRRLGKFGAFFSRRLTGALGRCFLSSPGEAGSLFLSRIILLRAGLSGLPPINLLKSAGSLQLMVNYWLVLWNLVWSHRFFLAFPSPNRKYSKDTCF